MEVLRVSPNRVRVRAVTVATVEGRNFRNEARAALDDRHAEVNRTWHFSVPDVDTVPYEATYLDSETVRIVLPASLPLGPHDLKLSGPSGDSATLEEAFTVESPSAGGAGGAGGAEAQLAAAGVGGADEPGGEAGDAGASGKAGAAGLDVAEPGPFNTPVAVAMPPNPSGFDDDPSFTDDLLELYFSSNRAGGPGLSDIWITRRATIADPWETPSRVLDVSGPGDDAFPGISGDGLTLWFCSDRTGGSGGHDIWVTTRADRSSPWAPPTVVPELSSPATDCAPQVSPSGLLLIITSDRSGGVGMRDLYWATRASVDDPWDTPTLIPYVNSPSDDSEGRLMADGLRLYFSSDRGTVGGYELYATMRASTADAFSAPVLLPSLNSPGLDRDPWLSPDLSYIMFTSDRDGVQRIYEAWR